jgi:hypothetical protein
MKTKTTFQPRTVGLLVTALLAAVLSSCGNSLCEGRLVGKYYKPEETYTMVRYDVVLKMPMTEIHTDPEAWIFMVKGFNGKDTVTERHRVTQQWWNEAVVGRWVVFQDCR